ncbi:DUF3710 domain-containing protein [Nostocoides sp. F2B08]|uniref:DUF3710 domain-containing protein n=1 Tax=Nostocoides sp. F2B08 TaxID=2653936 RepID=UPI00126347E9|nr:DUF3710 domain-containing protein [Tetrasphaera sp. F2B08]KAB7742418.1 DUF3710 domain-containing protein [Tetrasphaera sp. F2B08]
MGLFGRKKNAPVEDEVDSTPAIAEDEPVTRGPRDRSQVPDQEGRVDLGSIWLRGVQGMELRLEVDDERQKVVGAQLVIGDSQMQVQAYAAPKSSGIWDEIRDEIAQNVATNGGTAEEVEGPLGTELHARMPSRAANGRTVFSPARFVGVDGPRWFFRAVLSGRAAIDEAAAAPFYGLLDHVVVVRGDAPMAPREVLALTLPKNAARTPSDEGSADDEGGPSESHESGEPLSPFERGPEITETR